MFIVYLCFLDTRTEISLTRTANLESIAMLLENALGVTINAASFRVKRSANKLECFEVSDLINGENIYCVFEEKDFKYMLTILCKMWESDGHSGQIIITPDRLKDLFYIGYSPLNPNHTFILISTSKLVIPSATFFYVLEEMEDVLLPLGLVLMLPVCEVSGAQAVENYPPVVEYQVLSMKKLTLLISSLIPSIPEASFYYMGSLIGRYHEERILDYALQNAFMSVPHRFPNEEELRTYPPDTEMGYAFFMKCPNFTSDGSITKSSSFTKDFSDKLDVDDPRRLAIKKQIRAGGLDDRLRAHSEYMQMLKLIHGEIDMEMQGRIL